MCTMNFFFARCSTSRQHIAFFTLQLFAFCSFCDTSPHQSASTTPCLSGNHSLQGSHNTPKASLLLHETSSSYPSTAAKAAKAPAKTIELIHKQRVSRVIILHERCHPLVVCFMPHLHSFNNDWLFSASQTIFHIITVNEKRKYIIFLYKYIWKTAKPPATVIRIRVVDHSALCVCRFPDIAHELHMRNHSPVPLLRRRVLDIWIIHAKHASRYRAVPVRLPDPG